MVHSRGSGAGPSAHPHTSVGCLNLNLDKEGSYSLPNASNALSRSSSATMWKKRDLVFPEFSYEPNQLDIKNHLQAITRINKMAHCRIWTCFGQASA